LHHGLLPIDLFEKGQAKIQTYNFSKKLCKTLNYFGSTFSKGGFGSTFSKGGFGSTFSKGGF